MASKMLRSVGAVMILWAFVLVYMGLNLYQLVEDSRKSTYELSRVSVDVENLQRENDRLRRDSLNKSARDIEEKAQRTNKEIEEKRDLREYIEKLEIANNKIKQLKLIQSRASSGTNVNFEKLRRRISNQIREMWFYTSAQVTKLNKMLPETAQGDFTKMLDNFGELQRITARDFHELVSMNGVQAERDNIAKRLSSLVQRRIHHLQNPVDCQSAKKLVCSLNKGCGYGCQMHHVLYCFLVAYATERTLIIDSSGWRYSSKGWSGYFQPVSDNCIHHSRPREWSREHHNNLVVHLPIVDSMFPRPKQMPLSVPRDLYDDLRLFHGQPFVWWIGQFTKYLFNFQPNVKAEIDNKKKRLNFKGPIVGIQVRRTDKINLEAAYHGIEEYMYWVDLYYKQLILTKTVDKKRVFIATDDATVLSEAQEKYPEFEFISDNDVSKSAGLNKRYSDESLIGVISDIELLSDCDYLVCTFSSQVCRLAYEIMNHKHTDAANSFHSLDDIYYFGGQHEHKMRAIWPHDAQGRSEISLEVGDLVGIAGNHWDGQAKGVRHISQKSGLFPAYKVEDEHDVVDFPSYPDA